MELLTIGKERREDWDGFLLRHSPESFLQSFAWGEFQIAAGHAVRRFALGEGTEILAVASIVEYRLPLGFCYWYLPRGPVVASQLPAEKRNAIWSHLLGQIRSAAKKQRVIFLRLDPALVVESGTASEISAERLGLQLVSGSVQPKDTLVLDLTKKEEELLADMKPKTRYNLRLAEKKGVQVIATEGSGPDFEDFWRLMEETSARDGIVSHPRSYYARMLRTLNAAEGALRCRLYLAKFEGKVIAANIVLHFGTYAVYLHGSSSDAQRNLMAPYLLQWRQIMDAKGAGCRIYDFWGITVDNANPRWAGITRFKKGFAGEEVSYAGVYDLPLRQFAYALYARLRRK